MMTVVFWSAVGVIVYTYLVFPVLLAVRALLRPRPVIEGEITPSVTMIICAYNEAAIIGRKLDNVLSLAYPRELLEVIVASDGSDDGTAEIVERYGKRGVRLLRLPRIGKIAALNAAVAAARGEILVFSDANSIYAKQALHRLVSPFADPQVGGVAGDQRYRTGGSDETRGLRGERAYWDLDRMLKVWQSRAGSVTSATGAIYAVRRRLASEVPAGVTDDFVTSTRVIAQDYRLVFAPQATAYEDPAGSGRAEFRRKTRIMTRGLRAVLIMRALLNPVRYGFYALQLLTHKLLRRLVVLPLLAIAIATPFLWNDALLYRAAALAQLAVYGAGAAGALLTQRRSGVLVVFALPYYFCLVNAAALVATCQLAAGRRIDLWSPPRHDGSATGRPAPAAASAVRAE